MTKEEIKEAIASTIVENGQKGITATALANLLNEIVDAAGNGGGSEGGSGGLTLSMGLTDLENLQFGSAPSESNALVYQTIMAGMTSGVFNPVNAVIDEASIFGYLPVVNVDMFSPMPEENAVIFVSSAFIELFFPGESITFALLENGSIIMQTGDSE